MTRADNTPSHRARMRAAQTVRRWYAWCAVDALYNVIGYIGESLWISATQLVMVFGPLMLLAYVMHRISGALRRSARCIFGDWIYVWSTALGTAVHELGHALFCVIFRHRITDMKLFKPDAQGTLGYVEHGFNENSRYQRIGHFFIGTGPLWLGSAVMYGIIWVFFGSAALEPVDRFDPSAVEVTSLAGAKALVRDVGSIAWDIVIRVFDRTRFTEWSFYAFLYLVFCIGSHVTLSTADIRNAAMGVTTGVGTVVVINLATLWMGDWTARICAVLTGYSAVICGVMFVALVINIVLAAALWIPAKAFDD